jgi:hypothetical protein
MPQTSTARDEKIIHFPRGDEFHRSIRACPDLNPTARLLWLLVELSDNPAQAAFAGRSWMAAELGCSRARVRRSLRVIERSGLFERRVNGTREEYRRVYLEGERPADFEDRALDAPFDLCVRLHWLACVETREADSASFSAADLEWGVTEQALYLARRKMKRLGFFRVSPDEHGGASTFTREDAGETRRPPRQPPKDPPKKTAAYNREEIREEPLAKANGRDSGPRGGFSGSRDDPSNPRDAPPCGEAPPDGKGEERAGDDPPDDGPRVRARPRVVIPLTEARREHLLRCRWLDLAGDTPSNRSAFGLARRHLDLDWVEEVLDEIGDDPDSFLTAAYHRAGCPDDWGNAFRYGRRRW